MYSQVTIDDDHISRLPDDILSFILSFLSMRDAVKTRLLSHRWRRLCSSASNLHFDLLSIVGVEQAKRNNKILLEHKSKFLMGVTLFLQSNTAGPKIDTFQVTYPLTKESASFVDEWISFAIRILEVKTMCLDFFYCSDGLECYSFPCHLLSNENCLRNLHLKDCRIAPSLYYAKRLNSLKTLTLTRVHLDQSHLDSILSGCLNLESFKLEFCVLPKTFHICGPLLGLKSLIVYGGGHGNMGNMELNSLEKLDIFQYSGFEIHFSFVGVPALKKVYMSVLNKSGWAPHYVYKELSKDLPKLESLLLNFVPYEGIPIHADITAFKHLKQLMLFVCISPRCDILSIVHILNASPALHKFHLALNYSGSWNSINSKKLESKHLHLQLREVQINGFFNTKEQMELVIYLLNNCIALKRMIVCSTRRLYAGDGCWKEHQEVVNLEMVRDLLLKQMVNSSIELIVD